MDRPVTDRRKEVYVDSRQRSSVLARLRCPRQRETTSKIRYLFTTMTGEVDARVLVESFVQAADVLLLDDESVPARAGAPSVYGQWYEPREILDSLVAAAGTIHGDENVGQPAVPPICRSMTYNFRDEKTGNSVHEIPFQVHTTVPLRIRWIDEHTRSRASHTWNLHLHNGDWVQFVKPGDLFLFSIVQADRPADDLFTSDFSSETLLGAYRPLRPLPSRSFLSIVVEKEEHTTGEVDDLYVLETLLMDPYDALCLAASSLDPAVAPQPLPREVVDCRNNATTIKLVQTVLSNLVRHPEEAKYHRLRLSNPKIKQHVVSSWAAMRFLTLAGFEEVVETVTEEEGSKAEDHQQSQRQQDDEKVSMEGVDTDPSTDRYLVAASDLTEDLLKTRLQALELLHVLSNRTLPTFVPDLAPPTPWEAAQPGPATNGGWKPSGQGVGFITDEERWARAERIAANRRSGRARRPEPGQAPSSRGNWGR